MQYLVFFVRSTEADPGPGHLRWVQQLLKVFKNELNIFIMPG